MRDYHGEAEVPALKTTRKYSQVSVRPNENYEEKHNSGRVQVIREGFQEVSFKPSPCVMGWSRGEPRGRASLCPSLPSGPRHVTSVKSSYLASGPQQQAFSNPVSTQTQEGFF